MSKAALIPNRGEQMRVIAISTSKLHGGQYLEYLLEDLQYFLVEQEEVLFIPYAQPGGLSYADYTALPRKAFFEIGKKVVGIHEFRNPVTAIEKASSIFIGGGNTFLLLKTLYEKGLVAPLRQAIERGLPYMGSSAGSNITGLTVGTTNDMPIVYPPSFEALSFFPFNINPHYLDPDPNSRHMGETRETRINEFHQCNDQPVIGLREGSWLCYDGGDLYLKGGKTARLFRAGESALELEPGPVNSYLL